MTLPYQDSGTTMSVHDHLTAEERIVLQHPPFYLTTHRLLRCEDEDGKDMFREIPLRGMTDVEIASLMGQRTIRATQGYGRKVLQAQARARYRERLAG